MERTYPQKLRTQRGKYRAEYLAKAATIEDARANIPPSINPALWSEFVDREFKTEVKERNEKFKANRSANTVGCALGRKTYSQKHYEMVRIILCWWFKHCFVLLVNLLTLYYLLIFVE